VNAQNRSAAQEHHNLQTTQHELRPIQHLDRTTNKKARVIPTSNIAQVPNIVSGRTSNQILPVSSQPQISPGSEKTTVETQLVISSFNGSVTELPPIFKHQVVDDKCNSSLSQFHITETRGKLFDKPGSTQNSPITQYDRDRNQYLNIAPAPVRLAASRSRTINQPENANRNGMPNPPSQPRSNTPPQSRSVSFIHYSSQSIEDRPRQVRKRKRAY
jgi:hypothetical protein